LLRISEYTGEKLWQLPLFTEFQKQIKSDIAEIKNSGGRKGGTITAGMFLQSFTKNARWIHIDIAGKEMAEKDNYYILKGATGYGVRTIFEFIRQIA
jgi:leucyl aminopeptidase